jgi:hypothetical protein
MAERKREEETARKRMFNNMNPDPNRGERALTIEEIVRKLKEERGNVVQIFQKWKKGANAQEKS